MFDRNLTEYLGRWAVSEERKPLVIRGARQVGKTTVVSLFAKEFDQYIYMNLENSSEARFFTRELAINDLFQALLLQRQIPGHSGRMLLFIDEIQACPAAIKYLRYFYEDLPELYVIAAGSLLELALARENISFPVGRVEHCFMYPLTFHEFLRAIGDKGALVALKKVPVSPVAANYLQEKFRTYTLIGGMPEIVARYVKSKDIAGLSGLYKSLLVSFIDDASKYARNHGHAALYRHAIESAPLEAGKRISYNGFGSSLYRSREMGEALRTLERAMLLRLIPATTSTEIPIIPDRRKSPRLLFLDTGLVNAYVGLQHHYFEPGNLHSIYRGRIAEHIVAQELLATAEDPLQSLVFWVRQKRQANAEVDFVIRFESSVIPVEVKAGKSGTLRSLHQFIDRCGHGFAVRLYDGPMRLEQQKTGTGKPFKLLNLPLFLAGSLRRYLHLLVHAPELFTQPELGSAAK